MYLHRHSLSLLSPSHPVRQQLEGMGYGFLEHHSQSLLHTRNGVILLVRVIIRPLKEYIWDRIHLVLLIYFTLYIHLVEEVKRKSMYHHQMKERR